MEWTKLKTLDDFKHMIGPEYVPMESPPLPPENEQWVLRMLVRPKYGDWIIPPALKYLEPQIKALALFDEQTTGISNSWCYVTVRHGPPTCQNDDEWHLDGASLRVELISERNYVWYNHTAMQYKTGSVNFPVDFDANKHHLFTHIAKELEDRPIYHAPPDTWWRLSPRCLHRRNPEVPNISRTFYRISFIDIEVRDEAATQNPLLRTEAWGRNPVQSFRNQLTRT